MVTNVYFTDCRAIFLWLCSKDLTKLNFDNVQKGSPEEILMNLQQGLTTYAVVFEILCRYCHIVSCNNSVWLAPAGTFCPGLLAQLADSIVYNWSKAVCLSMCLCINQGSIKRVLP